MHDVTKAEIMQRLCAEIFLRRMKMNPAVRKIALKPLSEALTAGKSWMLMKKSGKRKQIQSADRMFLFSAFRLFAFRFFRSSFLTFQSANGGEQFWFDGVGPIHVVAAGLKNAAQLRMFVHDDENCRMNE